jgi:hypothetical protein
MNPFKYGMVVSGKDFCGRKVLLKQICDHIISSQRLVILGERRIGKTSAVCEAVNRCKNARMLYVDLLGIKSVDGMCRRILKAILVQEQKKGWFEKIVKTLAHLRPSISVDPVTSLPTVSFDSSIELKADSIPEVFNLIESLGKKQILVVVFDEFQDILNLEDAQEALALLRGEIQFQGKTSFIFVGSIRHKMEEIFTNHDSPFFKSAITFSLDPLPYEEFSKFLKNRFSQEHRKVDDKVLEKAFQIAENIPGDIQQLCGCIWEITSEKEIIGINKLKNAMELVFAREQKSYESYIRLLTNIQFKVLTAIAKSGGRQVFSAAFMKPSGFTNPSTVRRAVNRLLQLNILFESSGEYRFVNPFFRAWIIYQG